MSVLSIYFPSWSIYDRKNFIWDLPFDKITHLNYAFADLKGNGCAEIVLKDSWADCEAFWSEELGEKWEELTVTKNLRGNLGQLYNFKKKYPHLKTGISVGGANGLQGFSNIISTKTYRSSVIDSLIRLISNHGFDYVDIDWEFPQTNEDFHNFFKFMQELRIEMDHLQDKIATMTPNKKKPRFFITMAIPGSLYHLKDWGGQGILIKCQDLVDFYQVMGYDFAGHSWSTTAKHHANLYSAADNKHSDSVFATVEFLTKFICLAPSKIVLGIPSYGRTFLLKNKRGNASDIILGQPICGPGPSYEKYGENGLIDYKTICSKSNLCIKWDSTSHAPYAIDSSNGETVFISFDNDVSVSQKMKLILDLHLRGAMFWEFSGDLSTMHEKSLIKVAHDTIVKCGKTLDKSTNSLNYPLSNYTNLLK